MQSFTAFASILVAISAANAVTITSALEFGYVDKATPSNEVDEESRLELLIKSLNGDDDLTDESNYREVTNTYDTVNVSDKKIVLTDLVDLSATVSEVVNFELKNQDEGNSFNHQLNGMVYEWLAVKQGTKTTYYWIGNVTDELVYESGWSHYSLFNKTSVPDSGTTLILLGAALAGLGFLRRRR